MISIAVSLYETYKNYQKLRKMSFYEAPIHVFRDIKDHIENNQGILNINENIM